MIAKGTCYGAFTIPQAVNARETSREIAEVAFIILLLFILIFSFCILWVIYVSARIAKCMMFTDKIKF